MLSQIRQTSFRLKFQDTFTTNWFFLKTVSNYFVLRFFCTSRVVCSKARRFTTRTGIIVVNFVVYKGASCTPCPRDIGNIVGLSVFHVT